MATAEKPTTAVIEKPANPADRLPALRGPRLPFYPIVEERFGIDRASWKALCESIFPNATSVESIVLALSYCKARKLDPFKRVVHIVAVWNSQLGGMIDTVWPGIGELRTTAFRTGEYAGRTDTVFGPDVTKKLGSVEITFPEWGQVTVKRMLHGQIVDFVGPRVYWEETYATKSRKEDTPNEMWATRPRGQLDKCSEAAALRAAFPEECGGDYIPEEVQGSRAIDTKFTAKPELISDMAGALEGPPYAPHVTPDEPENAIADTPETLSAKVAAKQRQMAEQSTDTKEPHNPLAGVADKLDKCEALADVNAVHEEVVTNPLGITEDDEHLLDQMCEAARERIRSTRGSKAEKSSGKLLDKGSPPA